MRPVRVSTIVWGVLLLLIAGVAFAVTALDIHLFSGASIAYLVVGLGALLVVAALVGAVARLTARGFSADSTSKDQPVD